MGCRQKTILNVVKDFIADNKKYVVSFLVLFLVGVIVGIVTEVNSNGGEFEKIARGDMVFGAVKVFFFSALFVAGGYVVVVLAGNVRGLAFLSVAPFFVLGLTCGRYVCVLVACYGGIGISNLIFIYIPFYFCTLFCLIVGACGAMRNPSCVEGLPLRSSVIIPLKLYLINEVLAFFIYMIIGAVTKVVVISL